MKQNLNHIKTKVAECIKELGEAGPGSTAERHPLFQLSYNLGRLSELTGLGREVYDAVKGDLENGDYEHVQEYVDTVVEQFIDASRVAYVVTYGTKNNYEATTTLDLQALPRLGVTDDHIVLDAIRDISSEWSDITHKD